MGETNCGCVQRLPGEPKLLPGVLLQLATRKAIEVALVRAVDLVTYHRESHVPQMHSNLVLATRLRIGAEKREMRSISFEAP
jgi:hypothetical protein